MINNIVKISLIIGLILTAAKENITKGQSHNERVTIVGSFQPQIGDFSKINIEPGTEQAEFRKAELRYTFIDRMAETKTEIENIPALVVVPDRSTDIFNNYFRFGFGSLITPSVLFRHHSEVEKIPQWLPFRYAIALW